MKTNKSVTLVCLTFLVVCLMSCASLDFGGMTAKDYGTLAMGVYVDQFESHKLRASNPNITDKERSDLQDLKKDLVAIYPVIKAYNLALDIGDNPTEADAALLMAFLSKYYYGR